MIEVEGLSKRYGPIEAIRNLNFRVEKGDVMGFLGPNGAGKTTTMRILTGYMPPSEGKARVAGFDVVEESLEVRRHVGYLPETVPLYPDMTVGGYVHYIAALRGVPELASRVEDVLKTVGMYERRDSLIRSISKGMRQRVGLAQAIVHEPDVLILDEPTIGLDPLQTLEVRDMVRGLGKEHSVLFSTHILSEAEQVCDRVIIIDKGQIVAMDTPQTLRERLQKGGRLLVRIGKAPSPDEVRKVLGAVVGVNGVSVYADGYAIEARESIDVRARVAAAVVGANWELLELRPLAMSLEEIFLELMMRQKTDDEKKRERRKPHA
jgi:ABC-2 type transport system ATP-binding protein